MHVQGLVETETATNVFVTRITTPGYRADSRMRAVQAGSSGQDFSQ